MSQLRTTSWWWEGRITAFFLIGVTNATVENNTVISQGGTNKLWLGIAASKQGALPVNVVVRNNIANAFNLDTSGGVIYDHNLSFVNIGLICDRNIPVVDPLNVFVKYSPATASFDFHLLPGSPAIGAGSPIGAPTLDYAGKVRNPLSIDIGAFAY